MNRKAWCEGDDRLEGAVRLLEALQHCDESEGPVVGEEVDVDLGT